MTVQGKGSFISVSNSDLIMEERRKDIENDMERVISKARQYGMDDVEIRQLFNIIMEEYIC